MASPGACRRGIRGSSVASPTEKEQNHASLDVFPARLSFPLSGAMWSPQHFSGVFASRNFFFTCQQHLRLGTLSGCDMERCIALRITPDAGHSVGCARDDISSLPKGFITQHSSRQKGLFRLLFPLLFFVSLEEGETRRIFISFFISFSVEHLLASCWLDDGSIDALNMIPRRSVTVCCNRASVCRQLEARFSSCPERAETPLVWQSVTRRGHPHVPPLEGGSPSRRPCFAQLEGPRQLADETQVPRIHSGAFRKAPKECSICCAERGRGGTSFALASDHGDL